MKKLLSILAISAVGLAAYGQGTVVFTTSTPGQRVMDANGSVIGDTAGTAGFGVGISGTNFFAQLWAAPGAGALESALQPVRNFDNSIVNPLINLRNGANAGFVQASGTTSLGVAFNGGTLTTVVSIPGVTGGGPTTIQLRVWYSLGNTIQSWASAVASGDANMRLGKSALVTIASTGDPFAGPPTNPTSIAALTGFQLVAVPEPSSFALAGLGMASLLIFRRRK
jgi:hypothetical protein